jgi:hypothetical protein
MLRLARTTTAILIAALGLVACGGGDETRPTSAEATTTTGEPTEPRRQFEDQTRTVLSEQGRGQGQLVDVECVIERLRGSLPDQVVEAAAEAAGQGQEIPQQAVDAAFEAGRACASG